MDATDLLQRLRNSAQPIEHVDAPAKPGIYAWFLDDPSTLRTLSNQGADPMYVGISDDLQRRGDEDHFRPGGSGFSTLRRSLGALLKEQLGLSALPRSPGRSEQNVRCYKFDDAGERRLSDWMGEHLRVAVVPHSHPESIEREVIQLACPPLNLTGWTNPHAREIKALRKACADEARRRTHVLAATEAVSRSGRASPARSAGSGGSSARTRGSDRPLVELLRVRRADLDVVHGLAAAAAEARLVA